MDKYCCRREYLCHTARNQDFSFAVTGLYERTSWGGTLNEMIFGDSVAWIVFLFARPIPPPLSTVSEPSEDSHEKINCSSHLGPRILTLPAELHYAIFNFLDIQDVMHLGLTCQYFWTISRSVITKYFTKFLGVWAGASVTCTGEDNRWPYREFGKDELGLFNFANGKQRTILAKRSNSMNLLKPELHLSFPDVLLRHALELVQKCHCPVDLLKVTHPVPASFYPTDRQWVLRNLTTRQFVTARAIALKPEYIRGPFIDVLGFGEVIIAQTFYATHDVHYPEYCFDLQKGTRCKGVWAGHALDIVPLDSAHIDGLWKDASDKVVRRIARICEAKFGEEWREKLISRKCRASLMKGT
ncbi:hypothetical protein EMCG_03190 [[Emmonsia] crescens]|uniref:F-box domain-containing protein n=1 Tax=[Emmonsia] crescens TaxID=73230 RepID=A0A0G2HX98_9EURO|nr:hypothetical protein EMCG_03190 [Emmonsia crescens UAMH 3008]